ncbi:MAG: response regulator transcription factor [Chloroflexi bacterium]|nr:response regulator transcription factor [Chloroflexota bacterium]
MTTVAISAALPSVRLGLTALLAEHGHTVIAEDGGEDAAVTLLDAPDQPALDALGARRYTDSPRAAVVLTDDPLVSLQLARVGLRGWACLGRDVDAAELDLAVRAADGGLVLLGLAIASNTLNPPAAAAGAAEPLTPRELQVLQLVAQGMPNKGIARALTISENTAKFHVASLSGKLGASSRTEAVTIAARRGLIIL